MFNMIFLSWIGDAISDAVTEWWNNFISKALLLITGFFCKIVYAVEQIFFWLLGTEPIPKSEGETLFKQMFEDTRIGTFVGIFFTVALALWIICLVVSLIKGMMNQDTPGATKKALVNSFKAIIGIVVIPFLCVTFFSLSLNLIQYIVNQLNGGSSESITTRIWEAGYNGATIREGGQDNPFLAGWDEVKKWRFQIPNGTESIKLDYNFFNVGNSPHFDYFIVILGSMVLGICMAIATIKLCGRLINIIILYIISPVVVATMSIDDGKRFEAWKEISISKLFSILGSVLAMYIYMVFLNIVVQAQKGIASTGGINIFISVIFFLICAISGALMVIKGSDMLDSIVSQNAGGQDGLSPMGMASLGRVLGRGIGKAKGSLFGKPSAKGGNGGAGGGANSGGNGTFNKTGSTGAWGSLKNAMGNSPMGKALNSIKQNGLIGAGVNAVAGIGTGIKDNHQINQELKDVGFKHPNFHPILKHEQKQAIKKDRQQLQNLKNQGVNKTDLQALKKNRLGSAEFRTNAIAIANKHKKEQEKGVYR